MIRRMDLKVSMNPHVESPEKTTAKKKAYIAPAFSRLTPEEAKDLLLRRADVKDPDVMKMLQCIEELQRKNEPKTSR
jgi:hypothetical protein